MGIQHVEFAFGGEQVEALRVRADAASRDRLAEDPPELARLRVDQPDAVVGETLTVEVGGASEEMVQLVVSEEGADPRVLAHLGRIHDEVVVVAAAVRVQEEHSADAAEDRAFLVVRLAVHAGAGTVAGVIDDFAVQVEDLNADGQAVVRVLGVVGVLRGHDEVVGGDRQGGAVLRAGFEHDRLVVALRAGKFFLVVEVDVAFSVGEHCRPAVGVDEVDRPFNRRYMGMTRNRLTHGVEVVAVLHEEDTAVEEVDAVIRLTRAPGEDEGVAVRRAGVDRGRRSTDLEGANVHLLRREVDH